MMTISLSSAEIAELTNHARRPSTQLKRLRAAGYSRARIVDGAIVLEREHVHAVCHGTYGRSQEHARPRVVIPERAKGVR